MDELLDDILGYDEVTYSVPDEPQQQQQQPERSAGDNAQAAKRGHSGEQQVSVPFVYYYFEYYFVLIFVLFQFKAPQTKKPKAAEKGEVAKGEQPKGEQPKFHRQPKAVYSKVEPKAEKAERAKVDLLFPCFHFCFCSICFPS